MTHVLVVDDEPQILRALVLSLSRRGFQTSAAADARTALMLTAELGPDLILLDLGLPDLDGLEVIRRLQREDPGLPIVVLSARNDSSDKIVALDLGAVDYVTKPFDMNELLARLRAVVRRAGAPVAPRSVGFGDVQVDLGAHLVIRAGEAVHLTPTEWRLLEMLLERPGSLVNTGALLTELRGDPDHTESSYLRIYMAQLRRKLEPEPSRPRYFITEAGMGYRFQP